MTWRVAFAAGPSLLMVGCYLTHPGAESAAPESPVPGTNVRPASAGALGGEVAVAGRGVAAAGRPIGAPGREAGAVGREVGAAGRQVTAGTSAIPPGWLRWCASDDGCDQGFVCVVDACSARCDREQHPACAAIHATAVCHTGHGMGIHPDLLLCDYYCNSNAECAPFGPNYECWWQRCRGNPIK